MEADGRRDDSFTIFHIISFYSLHTARPAAQCVICLSNDDMPARPVRVRRAGGRAQMVSCSGRTFFHLSERRDPWARVPGLQSWGIGLCRARKMAASSLQSGAKGRESGRSP